MLFVSCLEWLTCIFLFKMVEFKSFFNYYYYFFIFYYIRLYYSTETYTYHWKKRQPFYYTALKLLSLLFQTPATQATLIWDFMSRNGRRQGFMVAWVCIGSVSSLGCLEVPRAQRQTQGWRLSLECAPLPLRKNRPLAAQFKKKDEKKGRFPL